jgi:hypothetical protein
MIIVPPFSRTSLAFSTVSNIASSVALLLPLTLTKAIVFSSIVPS